MKNKNTSFAAESKRLIKLYSRASWDVNEKRELDAALQKLSQEQEQYKMDNQIGEYSPEAMQQKAMQQQQIMAQQSQGQLPQGQPMQPQMQPDSQVGQMMGQPQQQFAKGGTFGDNFMYMNTNQMNQFGQNSYSNPNYYTQDNTYQQPNSVVLNAMSPTGSAGSQYIQNQNNAGNYVAGTNAYNQQYNNPQQVQGQDQQIGQTQSILPSVIAGGIGMIGNGLLAASVKDNQFTQSYGANEISLAKERERLSREATTARNIGMRNLTGAGSRGAYLAGAGDVSAGVNQQLGDALSQSYFKEGITNMQQRQRADELNKQVAMMNYRAKINAQNERRGYLGAAAQIPSQTMRDIGRINYQNSALLSSGTDNYIAGTNGKSDMWKSQQIYRKFRK